MAGRALIHFSTSVENKIQQAEKVLPVGGRLRLAQILLDSADDFLTVQYVSAEVGRDSSSEQQARLLGVRWVRQVVEAVLEDHGAVGVQVLEVQLLTGYARKLVRNGSNNVQGRINRFFDFAIANFVFE